MKQAKIVFQITITLTALFLLLSCNAIENETKSGSLLVVESLTGVDMEGTEVNFLQSDVLFQDPDTLVETIYADLGKATLRVRLLDPASAFGPSQYNNIMLDKYVVSFFRADGNNREGIDIPYSFEGYLSTTITVDTAVDINFVVVREVAKMEPPLVDLANSIRDVGVLECRAKIEFYGHDQVNKTVKAVGYLTVFFANYANEAGSSGGGGYSPLGAIK